MLMDGILERLAVASGCIERGELGRKAQVLHSCTMLIAELRGSLNMQQGGEIARNLSDLYEYMARQLLRANVESKVQYLKEVAGLLGEVRSAWVAIGSEARTMMSANARSG
jgi:flagellar protein FliS